MFDAVRNQSTSKLEDIKKDDLTEESWALSCLICMLPRLTIPKHRAEESWKCNAERSIFDELRGVF